MPLCRVTSLRSVACRGQEIELPSGDYDRLYILAAASEDVWTAIVNRRIGRLAAAVNDCAGHISAMSTTYLGNGVGTAVDELRREAAGCFPQGAGCGGYIACVDEHPRDRIRIRLRRPDL